MKPLGQKCSWGVPSALHMATWKVSSLLPQYLSYHSLQEGWKGLCPAWHWFPVISWGSMPQSSHRSSCTINFTLLLQWWKADSGISPSSQHLESFPYSHQKPVTSCRSLHVEKREREQAWRQGESWKRGSRMLSQQPTNLALFSLCPLE